MLYMDSYDDARAEFWWGRVDWDPVFCLIPRRSDYSGKWIWGPGCMRGSRLIHGPGQPLELVFWMTQGEYVTFRLADGD